MKRPKSGGKIPHLLLCSIFVFGISSSYGQGIRKHYTQITESERIAFQQAVDQLYTLGIVEQYADIHSDPDQDGFAGNNFNGPDTDSQIHRVNMFLPWHRQFITEFERELQAINPRLTIPYWDWTGDLDPTGVNSRSSTSPIWNDQSQVSVLGWNGSLIGKYDLAQGLNRSLSGTLPTSTQKDDLLTSNSYLNFGAFRFELEIFLHDPPHGWVGGQMQNMFYSPRDMAFYLHHAMVDLLWQKWTENGRSVSFTETSMPTFDGTVAGFSRVDPDNIRNTVTQMGVFYADPTIDFLELHDYTVQNAHLDSEQFIFPDELIVMPSFQFSTDAIAEIHSCTRVRLLPGVHIPQGATVTIGTNGFCNPQAASVTPAVVATADEAVRTVTELAASNVAESTEITTMPVRKSVNLKGFPNPFRQTFTFQFNLPEAETVSMVLFDALGKVVATPLPQQYRDQGEHQLLVDARELPNGIYSAVLLLHDTDQRYVLRVVKSE